FLLFLQTTNCAKAHSLSTPLSYHCCAMRDRGRSIRQTTLVAGEAGSGAIMSPASPDSLPLSAALQVSSSSIKVGSVFKARPPQRRKGRKSMRRRSGQNGTVVVQNGWYRVRWRQDVRSQERRVQMSEKIAPAVFDKEGKPKPPSPNIRRKAREIVENSGANSEQIFNEIVQGGATFEEQTVEYLVQNEQMK